MKQTITPIGLVALLGAGLLFGSPSLGRAQPAAPLEYGQALFNGHCAACHGIRGDGTGPAGAGLTPPPTNFRNATVMAGLTDSALGQAITAGKPPTAMRAYGTLLTPADVADLVAYLRSLASAP